VSTLLRRWVALLVAYTVGLAAGLAYTWGVNPSRLTNTRPDLLRQDHRQEWVRLVALSYVKDGNLTQAESRLQGLDEEEVASTLSALIEGYAAQGRSADTLRRLSGLAEEIGLRTSAMLIYVNTPAVPRSTPTDTPLPTPTAPPASATPLPTDTPPPPATTPPPTNELPPATLRNPEASVTANPTRHPSVYFEVTSQDKSCVSSERPRIEIEVQDANGDGVAGIGLFLLWNGEMDRAVTGVTPGHDSGYADFDIDPGVDYDLSAATPGLPMVSGILGGECSAEAGEGPAFTWWQIVVARHTPDEE
jgi:hypothetical protein